MPESVLQTVTDLSQVAEARRTGSHLGTTLGFSPETTGNLAIVVTELATNLVTHAGGGRLLFRPLQDDLGDAGVEVLSLDNGPGMSNVNECLRDGFSTAGTPGNGLGAVKRLSSVFDIYSKPGQGTVILSEVWGPSAHGRGPSLSRDLKIIAGIVNLAVGGETECGDSWSVRHATGKSRVLVIDGLGHGIFAAEASAAGVKAFNGSIDRSPREHISAINDALRPTRGAAGAVAVIDHSASTLTYCGIGNISSVVASDDAERHLVSHNGTLGRDARIQREFAYAWTPASLLIMTSDGLTTRWTLNAYPGIRTRHPAIVAGVLYRDFCRGRDDATVLVLRERGA